MTYFHAIMDKLRLVSIENGKILGDVFVSK
jgi:hypothetical protein